jgi:hypothetical protein
MYNNQRNGVRSVAMCICSWLIQLWFISCISSFSCYATAWAISRLASTSTAPLLLSFQGVALYYCCLYLLLATVSIFSVAGLKSPLACPPRPHCTSPQTPILFRFAVSGSLAAIVLSFDYVSIILHPCPDWPFHPSSSSSVYYSAVTVFIDLSLFIHFLSCLLNLDHRFYLRCICNPGPP